MLDSIDNITLLFKNAHSSLQYLNKHLAIELDKINQLQGSFHSQSNLLTNLFKRLCPNISNKSKMNLDCLQLKVKNKFKKLNIQIRYYNN